MTAAVGIAQSGVNSVSWRNRIINGDMRIDQRNNGASLAISGADTYTLDRLNASVFGGASGRFSVQRSTTAPAGFVNSALVTVTTADAAPASTAGYSIRQLIEGSNIADLGWGAAGAATVTLSFVVRSSVTGTFPVIIYNSGSDRAYGATYTISAANTFETKSITIPGDTTGTWLTTTGIGMQVAFGLGGGSNRSVSTGWQATGGSNLSTVSGCVNLMATNGATFYITGVQLERGTSATPFDYRDYGRELIMCQRYYFVRTYGPAGNTQMGVGQVYTSSNVFGAWISITNNFRAAPTLVVYPSPTAITIAAANAGGANGQVSGSYTPAATDGGIYWDLARSGGGLTAGNASALSAFTTATFGLSAEL